MVKILLAEFVKMNCGVMDGEVIRFWRNGEKIEKEIIGNGGSSVYVVESVPSGIEGYFATGKI